MVDRDRRAARLALLRLSPAGAPRPRRIPGSGCMKGNKHMNQDDTSIIPAAEIVPLRAGQARVEAGRDTETNAEVWLVSITVDGGELILSDHPTEHEAVRAALNCW
jgi:hypothetical protein